MRVKDLFLYVDPQQAQKVADHYGVEFTLEDDASVLMNLDPKPVKGAGYKYLRALNRASHMKDNVHFELSEAEKEMAHMRRENMGSYVMKRNFEDSQRELATWKIRHAALEEKVIALTKFMKPETLYTHTYIHRDEVANVNKEEFETYLINKHMSDIGKAIVDRNLVDLHRKFLDSDRSVYTSVVQIHRPDKARNTIGGEQ